MVSKSVGVLNVEPIQQIAGVAKVEVVARGGGGGVEPLWLLTL